MAHTSYPRREIRDVALETGCKEEDGAWGQTYLFDAPVAGDPLAHIHNFLPNVVATDDLRIGSLDTRALTDPRVKEFGAFFQAVPADEGLGIVDLERQRVADIVCFNDADTTENLNVHGTAVQGMTFMGVSQSPLSKRSGQADNDRCRYLRSARVARRLLQCGHQSGAGRDAGYAKLPQPPRTGAVTLRHQATGYSDPDELNHGFGARAQPRHRLAGVFVQAGQSHRPAGRNGHHRSDFELPVGKGAVQRPSSHPVSISHFRGACGLGLGAG